MKISFCTTCKGRLAHLKETLPVNLKAAEGFDVEFVIVDYDCQDFTSVWVKMAIDDPRVKVVHSPNHEFYDSQHAKNIAHRQATGLILFNLDADNMLTREAIGFIYGCFESRSTPVLRGSGTHGRYGQVAMFANLFHLLGGYDESLPSGWGADDDDIVERAQSMGMSLTAMHQSFTSIIDHPPEMRMDNFEVKDWRESNRVKQAARKKEIVANVGKEWGKI